MESAIQDQLDHLPFDVIGAILDGNMNVFQQHRIQIRTIRGRNVGMLLYTIYRVFWMHVHEIDKYVSQSLKTTVVDALTLLLENGLHDIDMWMDALVYYATIHGDTYTLAWIYQRMSRESRFARQNMQRMISKASQIHVDSLKWAIMYISNDKSVYEHTIEQSDQEVADIINSL